MVLDARRAAMLADHRTESSELLVDEVFVDRTALDRSKSIPNRRIELNGREVRLDVPQEVIPLLCGYALFP